MRRMGVLLVVPCSNVSGMKIAERRSFSLWLYGASLGCFLG